MESMVENTFYQSMADGLVVTCTLHDGIEHGAVGQSGAQREELGAWGSGHSPGLWVMASTYGYMYMMVVYI